MSEERFSPTFYEWPSYFSPPDVDDGPAEPPWECETCRDRGVIVESDHDPRCDDSGGKACAVLCPVEREYACPDCGEGRCETCRTVLAFMGYSGSPEDTYEVYACPKCDLPNPPWTPAPNTAPVNINIEDDEVPF